MMVHFSIQQGMQARNPKAAEQAMPAAVVAGPAPATHGVPPPGGRRAAPQGGRRQFGGTFLGIILGVMAGLAVALGVAIYVAKVPIPFLHKTTSRTSGR